MGDGPGTSEYGMSITRVFDAPRGRVWREWTEPAAFADWFGGPESEVPISSVSMDVRAGGKWRASESVLHVGEESNLGMAGKHLLNKRGARPAGSYYEDPAWSGTALGGRAHGR